MSLDINHYNALFLDTPGGNDATRYGAQIKPLLPTDAQHFRCIGVHHLTPEENAGNHHIYLDVLDEQGQRIPQAQIEWTWTGRRLEEPAPPATIDKPDTEPGTNIPINWAQTISVMVMGQPGDSVHNLHTRHPDEGENGGNTRGHHSFYVVFQRATAGTTPPTPPPDADLVEKYNRLVQKTATARALLQETLDVLIEDPASVRGEEDSP